MKLTQKDLKSGATSEYLARARGISLKTIGHEVWLENDIWHEKLKDGTVGKYSKKEAYTQMRTNATEDQNAPDYMRINGMWLKIHGLWIAPMVLIGYTSSSTSTSHPLWDERLTHDDDPKIPVGKHVAYAEEMVVTHDGRLAVHVVYNMFNTDAGTRVEEHCWSDFVYL